MAKGRRRFMVILVILLIVCAGVALFYFRGGGMSHVGINKDITDTNDKKANMKLNDGKVLVVYFSETGNTQEFARLILDQVGGDIRRLLGFTE